MQASARNRDAFAGSTGEDQPEQQTVWRKADPGTKGGVAAPTDGPALAAFEVVHHGLRHDEADTALVRVAHNRLTVWIEPGADAQAPRSTPSAKSVQLKLIIDDAIEAENALAP